MACIPAQPHQSTNLLLSEMQKTNNTAHHQAQQKLCLRTLPYAFIFPFSMRSDSSVTGARRQSRCRAVMRTTRQYYYNRLLVLLTVKLTYDEVHCSIQAAQHLATALQHLSVISAQTACGLSQSLHPAAPRGKTTNGVFACYHSKTIFL